MEEMVKAEDVNKVLIILDKKYSERADARDGGVGTETQIISSKIYKDVKQEKFIPIVTELDENNEAFMPTFLGNRIYIDFCNDDKFEEPYESLIRNIHNRPARSKPKLGKAPSYLLEDSPMSYKTSSLIKSFDHQVFKYPNRKNTLIKEFLQIFFNELNGYSVNVNSISDEIEFGKIIHDSIIAYTPLRNDYILFLDKLMKSGIEFDIENFIKFFEKLPILKHAQDDRNSTRQNEFDNFKFFISEIFLYTIIIGLKNENYKFVEEILYSGYFFKERYNYDKEPQRFDKLVGFPFLVQFESRQFYSFL